MSIEYNIKINNDVAKNAENVGDFGKSVNLIYDKIRNFNLQMVGKFDSTDILVESLQSGVFVGGVCGSVKCKALYIDVLFVEDGWRGSGTVFLFKYRKFPNGVNIL